VNGSAIALGGSATVTAVAPNALTLGSGLSGTSFNGSAAVTAAVDSTIPRLAGGNSFTGAQTITTSAITDKPLILNAVTGQTANLAEFQVNGSALATITNAGSIRVPALGDLAGTGAYIATQAASAIQVNARTATNVGLQVKGAASQSANLQEWQNSAGTVIASITSSGALRVGTSIASTAVGVNLDYISGLAVGVLVRAATSQTSDLAQYQSQPGTVIGGRNALAQIYTGSTTPLTTAVGGATTATTGTGTTATVTLTSAPNVAVGDLIVVAGITPTGYNGTFVVTAVSNTSPFSVSYANATTAAQTVAGTVSAPAQASITARSAGTQALYINAPTGYTAKLTSWAINGTTQAQVSSAGNVQANGLSTLTSQVFIKDANSGGQILMTRQTGAPATPGTNNGVLYFKAGTTGLALYAMGPTGTEVRIADNIT
jgi:hypothetical protein